MNEKQQRKDLEVLEILELIEERLSDKKKLLPEILIKHNEKQKGYRILLIFLSVIILYYFIKNIQNRNEFLLKNSSRQLSTILIFIGQILLFFSIKMKVYKFLDFKPKKFYKLINEKKRKSERLLNLAFITTVLGIFIIQYNNTSNNSYIINQVLFSIPFLLAIFILSNILFLKPIKLFSKTFTNAIEILYVAINIIIFKTLAIIIFIGEPNFNVFYALIYLVIFYLVFIEFARRFVLVFDKQKLNQIQIDGINSIKPKKLKHIINSFRKNEKIRNEANDYINKQLKKNNSIYLKELAISLASYNNRKTGISLSIILGALGFILASVGEGLVQDILSEPIKKVLCSTFSIFC